MHSLIRNRYKITNIIAIKKEAKINHLVSANDLINYNAQLPPFSAGCYARLSINYEVGTQYLNSYVVGYI